VEIYEEAFFYVNDEALRPARGETGRRGVVKLLQREKKQVEVLRRDLPEYIRDISFLPGGDYVVTRQEKAAKVWSLLSSEDPG